MNNKAVKEFMLASGKFDNEKKYWAEKLEGELTRVCFPYDFFALNSTKALKENMQLTCPAELTQKLNQVSNNSLPNLYIMLLTGVTALLYRYTGIQDIVIGTPVNKLKTEKNLMNTIMVLRNTFESTATFKELLLKVRNTVVEASSNQNYPAELLLRDAGMPMENCMQSLLQTMVVLNNIHEQKYAENANSNFVFYFEKKAESIEVLLQYNSELYTSDTASRIMQHLFQLLSLALGDVNVKLNDIDIISNQEKELLLSFNNTQRAYSLNNTIHKLFEQQVQKTPDNIAAVYKDNQLTYRQLNSKANILAKLLIKKGAKPEGIIGIITEPSLEMLIGVMAILKSGAAYLPIDTAYPADRVQYMLEDSGAEILITHTHLLSYTDFKGAVISLDDNCIYEETDLNNMLDDVNPDNLSNADNMAYVIYTSGSTGKPKGVMVEHRALVNLTEWHKEYYELTENDKSTKYAGFGFDASVWEIFPYITTGAAIYIIPDEMRMDIVKLNKYYEDNGITISFLPTQACEQFMKLDNKSLRILLTGGDKLKYYAQKPYKIANNYGPTENTVVTTSFIVDREYSNIPIGKPISNVQIYILDKNNKQQPIGAVGELCIGGSSLARGYLNKPELTQEKYIQNPFAPNERIYRTGDLARWLPDGNIEFLGRIDYQVKIRGFRIELGEIENRLLSYQNIKEAAVIDKQDEMGNKYLCAYITTEQAIDDKALRNYLSEALPDYMIPPFIMKLDKIPINANGKVDRKKLPDPDISKASQNAYEAPTNEVEEKLVELWKQVLGAERIGINDSFFELGGHSLKATTLISMIHSEFNVEVPLMEIFKSPTIKAIAQYIKAAEESIYSSIVPVETSEQYPLSSAQKRLYALQQFEPEGTSYNIPAILMLEGTLDMQKLNSAFKALIDRHESLRTFFVLADGKPVQVISQVVDFEISYIESEERDINKLVRSFAAAFDLSRAPLFRAVLIKLPDSIEPKEPMRTKHILMLDLHHIIADGISISILIDEFVKLYQSVELPKLKLQYKDYAAWQNNIIQSEKIKRQEQYWLNVFQGEIPVLNLPTDYLRPVIQSFEGDYIQFELDKALTERLREISRETESTLYMLLLAGYNILLSKYSLQEDIVVGTPTAGRPHADLHNIIGMFVNTLAMRNYPESSKTFREFLKEVKLNALKAYENQDYQFEELVDRLRIHRDMGRNPLFDVMFTMQNIDFKSSEIEALKITPYEEKNQISKFDMTMTAIEAENNIIIAMEYCLSLFKRETTIKMFKHYENILKCIADNMDIKLCDIEMLSDNEKHQLLYQFNSTKADYPRDKTIYQLFEEQAEKTPDNTAVICQESSFDIKALTYKQLNQKANQLARILASKGVKSDTVVSIMVEPSLEMLIGIIGIFKAGGAYLPIDSSLPSDRIEYMLKDSGTEILLTQSSLSDKVSFKGNSLLLDEEKLYTGDCSNLGLDYSSNSLAYVIYTSGTTGLPKGVLIENRSLVNYVKWITDKTSICSQDKTMLLSSYAFDLGYTGIYSSLLNGCELHMVSKELYLDPHKLSEYIQNNKISYIKMTPSLFSMICSSDKSAMEAAFDCIRLIILGGESINVSDVEKFKLHNPKVQIMNHYGPTETTIGTAANMLDFESFSSYKQCPTIGKPANNAKIMIVDKNLKLQPIGVAGELCVGGEGLARGYLNRPDLTSEKFIPNPFFEGEKMYKTGDLARWLSDGSIEFIGRIDHQVKIRGYRIELSEIEGRLLSYDTVREALVVVKEDYDNSKYLCGYFTGEKELQISELREYLSSLLPEYMVPAYLIQMDKMPLTPNGKIDRRSLPEPDRSKIVNDVYEAPSNDMERLLASIWSDILKLDNIGINDNFFSLGGHSLKAVALLAQVKEKLKVNIPMNKMFLKPTIKGMAEFISSSDNSESAYTHKDIVLIKESDAKEKNVFIIHDGTGEITGYTQLVSSLDSGFNYWGIRYKNPEGYSPIDLAIEEMAVDYIKRIKTVQPRGPYNIIGWSLGGLLTYEVVRQFELLKDQIGYIALIDTLVPKSKILKVFSKGIGEGSFSLNTERKFINSIIKSKELENIIESKNSINSIWTEVHDYLKKHGGEYDKLKNSLQSIAKAVPSFEYIKVHELLYIMNIIRSLHNAGESYTPKGKIDSQIYYFKAKDSETINPENWNKYCSKPIIFNAIEGDHFSVMNNPNVNKIAEITNNKITE